MTFTKGVFTLSFDCENEEDVRLLPKLAEELKAGGIAASFACIGRWVERYPEEHRSLIALGHEIFNHSMNHPNHEVLSPNAVWASLNRAEQKQEILRCHEVFEQMLKIQSLGFRTPHFGHQHSSEIYDLLKELGYRYSSSVVMPRAPLREPPYFVRKDLLEFPVSECPEHPGDVFDSWHCFRSPKAAHRKPKDFLHVWKRLLDETAKSKSYANVYFDPSDLLNHLGSAPLIESLEPFRQSLEILPYRDILDQLKPSQPEKPLKVSAVIFARNEEKSLPDVIEAAKPHVDEVLVMDGRSTDGTAAVAQEKGARVFQDDGQGKGSALRQSLGLVSGDVCIFLDADGSHDPNDIPRLLKPLSEGMGDLSVGSRFSGGSDELSHSLPQLVRTIGNILMNIMINRRWGVDLTDTLNGFRAIKTRVARAVGLQENIHTIEQEMIMKCLSQGYRVLNVPTHEYSRRYGESHINIWKQWPKFVWCVVKNIF